MSIEAKLEALTKAVEANTEVQTEVLKVLKSGGKAAPKAETETPKADKAAATEKTKAADEPAPRRRGAAADKPKKLTLETFTGQFGKFLDVSDFKESEQEEEENERKDFVIALTNEFGAKKVSLIKEEDWPRAIELLNKRIADPDFKISDDSDEGDGLI